MKWLPLMLVLSLFAGCTGEFDMSIEGEPPTTGWGSPAGSDPSAPGTTPGTVTEELTPGFTIERNELRLLPFHVRIEKLAMVTGLAPSDPMFDQIWASRYDLGDHNFGQGIGPDLSWNASKMATWVRAIQPICSSEVMAMRHDLPADTSGFMASAFGREPAGDEVSELRDTVAAQSLDEAGQYEAICLSILTSAEFVAQ